MSQCGCRIVKWFAGAVIRIILLKYFFMKTKCIYLLSQLAVISVLSCFALSKNQTAPSQAKASPLKSEINQILNSSDLPLKNFSLAVSYPLSAGLDSFYLAHNENKMRIPASLSKIVTAGAILHYFDPFHQFETSFLSDQPVEKGILKGSLYIKGGGDPSFVSESLYLLVNHLHRTGIRRVEGDLILDDFLFVKLPPQKKWKKDFGRSFNAPLSALSFNWNSVNIYIRPGLKLNDPAQIFIDPPNTFIQLKNQTKTKGAGKNIQIIKKKGETFIVRGQVPLNEPEFVVYRSVSDPLQWAGRNIIEFLKQRGIQVQGKIRRGRIPQNHFILARHEGRNILQLIRDMMKFSNNFIADVLTAQIAVYKDQTEGVDVRQGAQWIHRYLNQQGIEDYVFAHPSGLSRINKLKAGDLLKILSKDWNSLYSFEKISAYPLGGGDGSLKNRFKNVKRPALIRAKTGWLSGVVGLGGYARNSKGQTRAFVFLYNGKPKYQWRAQSLMDQLAVALTRY